ncbi:hypothetical protein PV08_10329 [Exophiala spinifera]|uniref:Uncharacterized protein n=1 Tax=Exophiala spinifera TaxID=91928 RepID=A0A0D2AXB0_9EURO|nr:uncharacterized protein PV08_10329 [Exophiala spinifera]KIW11030.1 hypothetical protein PV08_10329 [Exophiala spinifera]
MPSPNAVNGTGDDMRKLIDQLDKEFDHNNLDQLIGEWLDQATCPGATKRIIETVAELESYMQDVTNWAMVEDASKAWDEKT